MVEREVALKRTWFIQTRDGKLEDHYSFDKERDIIGSGAFATVVKATSKEGNHIRAIKILRKEKISDKEKFRAEIEILKTLDHPNVIKLFETLEDKRHVYLVTELCTGGEVFDRILAKGKLTESEAQKVFVQMVHAINYSHGNGVCHRDLKPENFLYLDKDDDHIKLIDFGLARKFQDCYQEKIIMTSRVGTSYYISPEVLAGAYDESCDLWSLGVILYIMLSGLPPFNGSTDQKIIERIKKGAYSFEGSEWKGVSESAKDLIRNLLCDPKKRLKAADVLKHPWILQQAKVDEAQLNLNYQSLKNFTNSNRFKKAALTVIASKLSEAEIKELSNMFTQLDKNGDGVLTFEEMESGLSQLKDKSTDIFKLLKAIDTDKSGTIDYTEFVASAMERNVYLRRDKLLDAFRLFDEDGNGKITAQELKDVLGNDPDYRQNLSYFEGMIREVDKDNDGVIDYEEFVAMMKENK